MPVITSMYDLGNLQDTGVRDENRKLTYPDHPHDSWYETLFIEGTADEITSESEHFIDIIAGQIVQRVGEGSHDGSPALVIHFKTGRMVIKPDTKLEWVRSWSRANDKGLDGLVLMSAYEDNWRKSSKRPKVSKVQIDINFNSGEDPDEMVAEWAAEYGVSFHLVDPHGPGGGCPVYRVTGLTDKVEAWLRGPYESDDDDVAEILG